MNNKVPLSDIRIDTKLSVIKSRHAKWVVSSFLEVSRDIIRKSWRIAGLFPNIDENIVDASLLLDDSVDLIDDNLYVC